MSNDDLKEWWKDILPILGIQSKHLLSFSKIKQQNKNYWRNYMTKILITGASGMIGKYLVDMCLEKDTL